MLRAAVATAISSGPGTSVLGLLERLSRATPDRLPVLTYHRIVDPDLATSVPGIASSAPARFAEQVDTLCRHWQPVSIEQVLDRVVSGTPLPERAVLITFDDAYADFETAAWPVLHGRSVPVVLFVPTGYPDQGRAFWWDRLHRSLTTTAAPDVVWEGQRLPLSTPADRLAAYRHVNRWVKATAHDRAMATVDDLVGELAGEAAPAEILGWDALRRLRSQGVALGAHSRHHPYLDRVAGDRLDDEIAGSIDDLRAATGAELPVFAYPGGQLTDPVVDAVRRAGIELAFTTDRGVNDLTDLDPLRLCRINVGARTTPALLRAQLLPMAAHLLRRAD